MSEVWCVVNGSDNKARTVCQIICIPSFCTYLNLLLLNDHKALNKKILKKNIENKSSDDPSKVRYISRLSVIDKLANNLIKQFIDNLNAILKLKNIKVIYLYNKYLRSKALCERILQFH